MAPAVCVLKILALIFLSAALGCASRIDRAIAAADELRGTQQFEAALQAYQQIIDLYDDPKVADVLLRAGDVHQFNLGQPTPAMVMYKRVLEAWPWQPAAMSAYFRLADLAEAASDHVGAIEMLEGLLRYFPSHPERHALRHRIGALYLKQKDYRQARIEFASVLDAPQVPLQLRAQLYFDTAESYLLADQPESAVPFYERLLHEFPEHALAERAWQQLAECHLELGEMGTAKALLREAGARRSTPDALPHTTVTLHPTAGQPVIVHAEVAATDAARARGLMYRRTLPQGSGMWFVLPTDSQQSFWMKNTYMALDLIFVDAKGLVVDIIANTVPQSEKPLTPKHPYRHVLEVPAGFAARQGIGVGSKVAAKP